MITYTNSKYNHENSLELYFLSVELLKIQRHKGIIRIIIYYILYNNPSYSRILIGSRL